MSTYRTSLGLQVEAATAIADEGLLIERDGAGFLSLLVFDLVTVAGQEILEASSSLVALSTCILEAVGSVRTVVLVLGRSVRPEGGLERGPRRGAGLILALDRPDQFSMTRVCLTLLGVLPTTPLLDDVVRQGIVDAPLSEDTLGSVDLPLVSSLHSHADQSTDTATHHSTSCETCGTCCCAGQCS